MITLYFLRNWAGLTALTFLALVIEHGVINGVWWFVLIAGVTVLIFVGITTAMFHEWRAHGAGSYHYRLTGKHDRVGNKR
jgi:uncharacterized membrane protein YesL